MTVSEFEAYTEAPKRKGGRLAPGFRGVALALAGMFEPGEPVLDFLVRVKWVTRSHDRRVTATALGLAVLQALDENQAGAEAAVEVVLNPDDPLAYSQLIGRVAEAGTAMIVDPYFRLDQLMSIAAHTIVTRVLTSDRIGKGDRASLADGIPRLTLARPFEVRIAFYDRMHDRLIIPDAGQVQFLGTSLSGVGKKLTVTGPLSDVASDALRKYYDDLWAQAEPVGTAALEEGREAIPE